MIGADGESLTDEIISAAREHGLSEREEGPFLLWLGNEVWEGRAEPKGLLEDIRGLVARFKADPRR